jgi:hypothetical protein
VWYVKIKKGEVSKNYNSDIIKIIKRKQSGGAMGKKSKYRVCPSCYYVGQSKILARGSLFVFVLLLPLFPIALLYAIICSIGPTNVCPECQNPLIPANSPKGEEIIYNNKLSFPDDKPATIVFKKILKFGLIFFIFSFILIIIVGVFAN